MDKKKKVMLHKIMPNQVSGPNNAAKRIQESYLSEKYEFEFLTQYKFAGGKISINLILDLYKQIKKFDPDLIHLSGLQASGFHAAVAAKLARKKVLMAVRGFSSDACNIRLIKKGIFEKIIEPLTIRLSDKIYTVCKEAANKRMIKRCEKKMYGVIHNPAPKVLFNQNDIRIKYREKFGIKESDFVVIVTGRMVYDKGISYIADAIENLDLTNLKFIFVGDGEYYDILKGKFKIEIQENKVFLLGKRNDVMELLTASDLFLFATLHENLSNSLLEAMTIGLPIIATNVGGNIEVVEDNINGYLINPKSSTDIVEKIKILQNDREKCKNYSIESKRIINERFTQEIIYREVSALYNSLINK
jgi:L-malate glycosyltransferase